MRKKNLASIGLDILDEVMQDTETVDLLKERRLLSNMAAKRAKQLKEGALPLVQIDSTRPLTIALAEIAAGKIKPPQRVGREAKAVMDAARASHPAEDVGTSVDGEFRPLNEEEKGAWGLGALAIPQK